MNTTHHDVEHHGRLTSSLVDVASRMVGEEMMTSTFRGERWLRHPPCWTSVSHPPASLSSTCITEKTWLQTFQSLPVCPLTWSLPGWLTHSWLIENVIWKNTTLQLIIRMWAEEQHLIDRKQVTVTSMSLGQKMLVEEQTCQQRLR